VPNFPIQIINGGPSHLSFFHHRGGETTTQGRERQNTELQNYVHVFLGTIRFLLCIFSLLITSSLTFSLSLSLFLLLVDLVVIFGVVTKEPLCEEVYWVFWFAIANFNETLGKDRDDLLHEVRLQGGFPGL
jgi:hypothetical protein